MVSTQALEYELKTVVYRVYNSGHFAETQFLFLKIGMLVYLPS